MTETNSHHDCMLPAGMSRDMSASRVSAVKEEWISMGALKSHDRVSFGIE